LILFICISHTYQVISCKIIGFCSWKTDFLLFTPSFSALDITDFRGFGRQKKQKEYFCLRFFKNKKHKINRLCFFWRHLTFVNISIFHTFPRVVRDIVATFCMLPYKCHTYLESLWSLLFVGISQHDAMLIKIEENWVSSPKADFCNFLTVSDIF